MRHIKNFFHNITDIFLAILIVAVAAGVIYWRMQIILDYPKTVVNSQTVTEEQAEEPEVEEVPAEEPAAEEPAGETDGEEGTETEEAGSNEGEAAGEDAAQ